MPAQEEAASLEAPAGETAAGRAVPARGPWLRPDVVPALGVLGATAALILGMKLVNSSFGSVDQLTAILVTTIFLVVASFGQGLVILIGGIDLSIGIVMGIGGMLIAGLTRGSNDTLIYALPLTLLCCAAIGLVNGIGVAVGRLPPFIATLAAGTTFYGVGLGLTAGSSQQPVAPALQHFMSGRWLGVPVPILFTALFVTVAFLFQNRTAQGRKLYAMGSSPGAARVLGLPTTAPHDRRLRHQRPVRGAPPACCWPATRRAPPWTWATALLMPTIAAVVIGGARVTGGAGLYLGTLAGALFLSTLSTVITVLSLSQGFRSIIQGGIIIAALLLQSDVFSSRRR